MKTLLPVALASLAACAVATEPNPSLERLKYNHPGLTVDLAVGLWAEPLPMDFDGDVTATLVPASLTYTFP